MATQSSHISQLPSGPVGVTARPAGTSTVHVFHMPSSSALTTGMSDDHPVMIDGVAYLLYGRLTVLGGANTVISCYLNHNEFGIITIPGGNHVGVLEVSQSVSLTERDYFNVQITTIGTSCGGTPSGLWVGIFVR